MQKYLSEAGFCSRRRGEKYIIDGIVKVNGLVVTKLGTKVDPETDRVEAGGTLLHLVRHYVYIALNKPVGYITSCKQAGEKTVLDLINIPERIYPVGRLDKDSKGLLLLTNNGSLHHRLLHPSFDHEKEYIVELKKSVTEKALRRLGAGLPIMGTRTRPAEITRLSHEIFSIILKEGKNRQIRRMVKKIGGRVQELKRIRVSNIKLGNLMEGNWRYLTEQEKKSLLSQF